MKGSKKILLAFPIITFGLGTWQLYRLQWKLGIIERLKDKKFMSPIDYPLDLDYQKANELEYTKIKVKGEFDNNNEMFLGPRNHNGEYGVHLIVPFKISETGKYILVNRGWIPSEKKEVKKRESGLVKGETELEGFIRKKPVQARFIHDNQNSLKDNFWYFIEPQKMLPKDYDVIVIEEVEVEQSIKKSKYPIGGCTIFEVRNQHLEYALTWYATSIATFLLLFSKDKSNKSQLIFKSLTK